MKILISIRPKWCKLIADGKKTLEVRKTKPRCQLPFKAFIYESKSTDKSRLTVYVDGNEPACYYKGSGKVIGEFICDKIVDIGVPYPAYRQETDKNILKQSCMTYMELHQYAKGKTVYGYYISNVVIYDEPRDLSDFCLKKAPMSWQYVKEKQT